MTGIHRMDDRRRVGDVATELAALLKLSVGELRDRFEELYGFACRTRNKDYLRKRLAWRIQELAEGGLSENARARIDELVPPGTSIVLPGAYRKQAGEGAKLLARAGHHPSKRDPRLPPVGTVLEREQAGVVHRVTVGANDFVYNGRRYASLSQVARAISGTRWNGFAFFRLVERAARVARSDEARR